MKRIALALTLVTVLAGCGGSKNAAQTTTQAPPAPTGQTTQLRVYFLRDGKVGPVGAEVAQTSAVAAAAMQELLRGPTAADEAIGLTTSIPNGTTLDGVAVAHGVATVALSPQVTTAAARAQVVYTLTQFPTVTKVSFAPGGKAVGRADFEDETPRILIENPLPFQQVPSYFSVDGTANTFEASFTLQLVASDGTVLDHVPVTATSGSGTRGTFTTNLSYPTGTQDTATVRAWEPSAENGQPLGTVSILVRHGAG